MVVPSVQAVAWQNSYVKKTHPHPSLPLEGEGEKRGLPLEGEGTKRSGVVIGCRGTIVLVELARQLQRGGVAVAGGQRLQVDRSQRGFLHDLQPAFLAQLKDRQESDNHAQPAFARLDQLLDPVEGPGLQS